MRYKIIASGSKGNAVIIDKILIDCGVPFKKIEPYLKEISLVLITHEHGDHLNINTALRLSTERPLLRFGGGNQIAAKLLAAGVKARQIDVLSPDITYDFGICKVIPFEVPHDVRCFGFKIFAGGKKIFYVTDAGNLNGIEAKNYDVYMIECNYQNDEELERRISQKKVQGEYIYERRVKETHLSEDQAQEFVLQNSSNGVYIPLHEHRKDYKKEDS